jgi:hypothetical protein
VEHKLTRQDKKKHHEQDRKRYAEHWLADFGSEDEKRLLRIWRKRGTLSPEDQKFIDEWLRDPLAIKRGRGLLFLATAKEKYLGKVVWETALERQKQLDDARWLVAYFTAQGKRQKRIASLTHLSERRVDDIIREIKDMIAHEFGCDPYAVGISEITRWFFGL